mmetsp:Transcript_6605/g.16349  ORF Transcript_6605/g.16349 Transcript_6605/m.16349 type:complete len:224 (+) Transcript_6605:146-817(+)|eukprot:CAMPEP_0117613250 /NCGR_PEP_ID=MMETSP0784-20121206/83367_1 /TAXON_ID=39447 /ORGANISM="" /LENGTH=223 /DNA_ID=CAMNT_0005416829 /DNA_START=133 /DNA_END=804 /DNA_ORIENTATION=+
MIPLHGEMIAEMNPQSRSGLQRLVYPAKHFAKGRQTSDAHPDYEVATLDAPVLHPHESVIAFAREVLAQPHEVARGLGLDAALDAHVAFAVHDVNRSCFACVGSRDAFLSHGDLDRHIRPLTRDYDLPAFNRRKEPVDPHVQVDLVLHSAYHFGLGVQVPESPLCVCRPSDGRGSGVDIYQLPVAALFGASAHKDEGIIENTLGDEATRIVHAAVRLCERVAL